MFKIIPILMGVVISYAVAVIMNAVGLTNPDGSAILDFTSVASAGLVGIPPIQICKFDVTAILVMAPIAIATMMEHVGDMVTDLQLLLLDSLADLPIPPMVRIPVFWS